jgi:hypothetical protein
MDDLRIKKTLDAAVASANWQFVNLKLLQPLAVGREDERLVAGSLKVELIPGDDGGVRVRASLGDHDVLSDPVGFDVPSIAAGVSGDSSLDARSKSMVRVAAILTSPESYWDDVVKELGNAFMTELRALVNKFLGVDGLSNSDYAKVDTVYVPGAQKEKIARRRNSSVEMGLMERLTGSVNRLAAIGNAASVSAAVKVLSFSPGGGDDEVPIWVQGLEFVRFVERTLGKNSQMTQVKRQLGKISEQNAQELNLDEVADSVSGLLGSVDAFFKKLPEAAQGIKKKVEEAGRDAGGDDDDDATVTSALAGWHDVAVASLAAELDQITSAATRLSAALEASQVTARFSPSAILQSRLSSIAEEFSRRVSSLKSGSDFSKSDMDRAVRSIKNSSIKSVNDLNQKLLDELHNAVGKAMAEELAGKVFDLKDFARKGGRSIEDLMEVNAEKLKDYIGVAGIEWGVSVGSAHSKVLLKAVLSSWRDVADVLGIDDKDVSLGGKFIISLGARGSKARMAKAFHELVPDKKSGGFVPVLAFTKDKGDGSFAHELFHAIDHDGQAGGMLDRGDVLGGEISKAARKLRMALISCPREEFVQRRASQIEEVEEAIGKQNVQILTLSERFEEIKKTLEGEALGKIESVKKISEEVEGDLRRRLEDLFSSSDGGDLSEMIHSLSADRLVRFSGFINAGRAPSAVEMREIFANANNKIGSIMTTLEVLMVKVLADQEATSISSKILSAAKELARLRNKLKSDLSMARARTTLPAQEAFLRTLLKRKSALSTEMAKASDNSLLTSCPSSGVPRAILAEIEAAGLYPSKYLESSLEIDIAMGNSKKPYFANSEELSARAFEVYVANALRNAGRENAYLSKADLMDKVEASSGVPFPYLTGNEKDRAIEAMGDLMETLKQNKYFKKKGEAS